MDSWPRCAGPAQISLFQPSPLQCSASLSKFCFLSDLRSNHFFLISSVVHTSFDTAFTEWVIASYATFFVCSFAAHFLQLYLHFWTLKFFFCFQCIALSSDFPFGILSTFCRFLRVISLCVCTRPHTWKITGVKLMSRGGVSLDQFEQWCGLFPVWRDFADFCNSWTFNNRKFGLVMWSSCFFL